MSFAKCLVLALSVVASVNGLTTPHAARHSVHHRSLAARVVEPRSANPPLANIAARAPRTPRRRCRPRTSSSSSSSAPSSTAVADGPLPPINAAPIPTSTRQQPTTVAPPPSPTTTSARPTSTTTTTKAPAPTKDAGGGGGAPNGFLAGTQHGEGTFYDTGLGACGKVNTDDDPIIAVSQLLFDTYPGATANPNLNPICGKKIRATRGNKSVVVTVVDRCGSCAMTDLDFSPTAFDALTGGNRGLGRVDISWTWV